MLDEGETTATRARIPEAGDVLGGFRVDALIGVGGMAMVYRAEQLSLDRRVALKVLSSSLTEDDSFRERFRREGKLAATLEHPYIIPIYDSGEADGLLFLAMRLIDGSTLSEIVGNKGMTVAQTLDVLRPIAEALDAAHGEGLIHRDVKPQNILVTTGGHPYLADFGIAKSSRTSGVTRAGGFVGSANYASPEQIRGEPLSPRSDLYSLTAVLYQCLTGCVTYPRDTEAGVLNAHLTEPPPTLPAAGAWTAALDGVIARGLAKDPAARYAHSVDLLDDATEVLTHVPGSTRLGLSASAGTPLDRDGERGAVKIAADDRPSRSATIWSIGHAGTGSASRRRPRILMATGALLGVLAVALLLLGTHGRAPVRAPAPTASKHASQTPVANTPVHSSTTADASHTVARTHKRVRVDHRRSHVRKPERTVQASTPATPAQATPSYSAPASTQSTPTYTAPPVPTSQTPSAQSAPSHPASQPAYAPPKVVAPVE